MPAIDFPNSPTAGQQFQAPTGILYQYGTPARWMTALAQPLNSQMSAEDNLLINGDMRIWQRGTSFSGTAGSVVRSADRWQFYTGVGSTVSTLQNVQNAYYGGEFIGFAIGVNRTVTGASDSTILYQAIEDVRTASNQTVTASFWVYAPVTGSHTLRFLQYFGSGGSPSANVNTDTSYTVASAFTWERKTVSVAIPSTAGKTLGTNGDSAFGFYLILPTGQGNGTWYFSNLDLRIGSVAPPQFLRRPYQQELALCQRYYQTYSYVVVRGYAAGTIPLVNFPLPVRMRTQPSVALNGQTYTNASSAAASAITSESIVFQINASAAEGYGYFGFTANAEL